MAAHAKASPSSAPRWLNCLGSIAYCNANGLEDKSSTYADEGTRAHAYAAYQLLDDLSLPVVTPDDEEMESFVEFYVQAVRRAAEGKMLKVELPIDISMYTGEPDAKGTSDAVIVGFDTLEVWDLKFGMGHIVFAERNEQLMLYALGVLEVVGPFTDAENIKLVICQPRRDHLSEWTISRADLLKFGEIVKERAAIAFSCKPGERLTPSDRACQWCPGKAVCPALRERVTAEVAKDFEQIPEGATLEYPSPSGIALVETWLKAVKKAIFEKLQRFEPVPGWKLVLGREGNRKWKDEAAVEEALKGMRIPKGDSHEQSLKSPAQLEKAGLSPKKWAQISEHITRSAAQPTMVEESDPKPAIQPVTAEEFDIFI